MLSRPKVNARNCAGVLAVCAALAALPAAAVNELGTLTLSPASVPSDTRTDVTVSVVVMDPAVDAASLKLTSIAPDPPGAVIGALGLLKPDGDDGMGHKRYSLTFPVTTKAALQVQLTYAVGPMPLQRKACRTLPINPEGGPLTAVTPAGITAFLADPANAGVKTAAQFLGALPATFKQHWIFMTRTESAQEASATQPRLLVPDRDGANVFSFEIGTGGGRKPEEIEYISFDGKQFVFHAIDMKTRKLIKGANSAGTTCASCHSGRPNWDAYDSWAGMLPYNRDRLYENSIELMAFTGLLKSLKNDPVVSRLELPKGFTTTCDGDIKVTAFDGRFVAAPFNKPVPYAQPGGGGVLKRLKFPGPMNQDVQQGGKYIVLHHSKPTDTDEGRGVALFDNLSALNARRIAADIVDSDKTTMDVRPIALAISAHTLDPMTSEPVFLCDAASFKNKPGDYAPDAVLDKLYAYHGVRSLDDLIKSTNAARHGLAPRKANLQILNLGPADGLIATWGGAVPDVANVAQEIFRRTKTADEPFRFDNSIKLVIDRENYGEEDVRIALLRLFMQPSKFDVENWSLSVLSRSLTFTFGDVLVAPYLSTMRDAVTPVVAGLVMPATCAKLQALSKAAFAAALARDPNYFDKPSP